MDKHEPTHVLEKLFARLRSEARWLMAGTSVVAAAGCAMDVADDSLAIEGVSDALLNSAKQDWAQREGQRNTELVRFVGQAYVDGRPAETLLDCGPRGGCRTAELLLHVQVRRQNNVDLSKKRVGVVYRREGPSTEPVSVYSAEYKGYAGDGWEDFHVKVRLDDLWSQGSTLLNLNAWYQPGDGRTAYDDNGGDLHVVTPLGAKPIHLWAYPQQGSLVFTDAGVKGKLSLRVANFDYDKLVKIHYTLDGVNWLDLTNGAADAKNSTHYVQSLGAMGMADWELWEADIDLPAATSGQLCFALSYTHGFAGKRVELWNNNYQQNYCFRAADYGPVPQ